MSSKNFSVNEFRWLLASDKYMSEFDNWSRPYEYYWVLDKIKSYNLNNPYIHNTCCGSQPIHLQFAKKLNETSNNVLHTDGFHSDLFEKNVNFKKYNLVEKFNDLFDIVVCVSTLEEISSENREKVFNNLLDQTKSGGKILITCDYPDVDLNFCENLLNQKIKETKEIKLNSLTSIAKSNDYLNLNIITIEIIKK